MDKKVQIYVQGGALSHEDAIAVVLRGISALKHAWGDYFHFWMVADGDVQVWMSNHDQDVRVRTAEAHAMVLRAEGVFAAIESEVR